MNLTYEITGEGYTILLNGKPWMVQDKYIPHPGSTVEESAQNHINEILKSEEENKPSESTESKLQDIMLAIAELANSAEQDKLETQLALAELASLLTGGDA